MTVVFHEGKKEMDSGPNHVLFWTLQFVNMVLLRFKPILNIDSNYSRNATEVSKNLESILRFGLYRDVFFSRTIARRPNPHALTQAARSRNRLYRLAYEAYMTLLLIEKGGEDQILKILQDTLIAPLETWRAFELAVALSMSEALSEKSGEDVEISEISDGATRALFKIGKYNVHWQSKTRYYCEPELERSEEIAKEIFQVYGLKYGDDRPDVIVEDTEKDEIVAIAEAKYFESETASTNDAFRSAVTQLVRYSRGYKVIDEVPKLLGNSVIALWNSGKIEKLDPHPAEQPFLFDFNDFLENKAISWAEKLFEDN